MQAPGAGAESINERMWGFILSKINRGILEYTPMIIGTVKEGIMEILDERLGAFRTIIITIMGAHTLSFQEFRACRAPEFFGEKDPIASRRWLADMVNAFQTSFCPKGSTVKFASCLLKDRA